MTRRTGLIDNAVDTLRQRITSGQWAVGTRIPPEPALAELLGVGRNTVREAVQSLVHAGLLARRQGSGTYVLSTSELAVTMGRQIADARQRDVVEVRRSLEVEAARLAARRRTGTDVTTLERLREQRAVAYAGGDLDEMVSTDLALHLAIARAARNPVLLSLYESLIDAISENIRFNFERPALGDAGHDDLVAAIVAGDEETAMTEVETYLSALVGRG
ncbi:FadR/GntR family transcriptional regulator [Cellulomonas cellasea]|uniref:GntR family transcriptional regulator n=2 Tax=Cellulomonas cellasea TaxID=43670 RepID=A0A0A0B378_9CELL|nr:FCD domain-containing protein [Cellulomonas cellasea]KGM00588.1 GntR family transcriptional regulator [Cellulomonas cellasea DSM 20118]GEA89517.1 GntR family transcriptional regulator [Cellulomonas cellasea]